jgi:hypothetical protein
MIKNNIIKPHPLHPLSGIAIEGNKYEDIFIPSPTCWRGERGVRYILYLVVIYDNTYIL